MWGEVSEIAREYRLYQPRVRCAGEPKTRESIQAPSSSGFSRAAELLSGRMAERARGDLEEFLLTLPLCQADVARWFRVGRLRNSLAAKGLSISTSDAHVAQCALDLGGDLLSADAIFRLVARHTKLSLFGL